MHGQKNMSTSYLWVEGIIRPLLPYFCTRYTIFADDRPVQDLTVTSRSTSKVWLLPLISCSSLQSITNCYGFYKSQCCRSYCFHFKFAIITISSLCAHNHMHFELSTSENHEHPPTMPLFANITSFCTSTFLTCSKGKLKQTLEEVIKLCKEVYLLQMSL